MVDGELRLFIGGEMVDESPAPWGPYRDDELLGSPVGISSPQLTETHTRKCIVHFKLGERHTVVCNPEIAPIWIRIDDNSFDIMSLDASRIVTRIFNRAVGGGA